MNIKRASPIMGRPLLFFMALIARPANFHRDPARSDWFVVFGYVPFSCFSNVFMKVFFFCPFLEFFQCR